MYFCNLSNKRIIKTGLLWSLYWAATCPLRLIFTTLSNFLDLIFNELLFCKATWFLQPIFVKILVAVKSRFYGSDQSCTIHLNRMIDYIADYNHHYLQAKFDKNVGINLSLSENLCCYFNHVLSSISEGIH